MAITKVSRGLLNTGVSDSSDATAITIDSSENITLAGTINGNAIAIGQSTFTGGNTLVDIHGSGSGVGANIAFANDHNTDKFFVGISGDTSGDALIYNAENSNMIFGNNNAEKMRIDSSGNVGIGDTSPHSFGTNQSGLTISDGTGGCIRLKNDAGSVNFDIENGGGSGIKLNSVNAFPLIFATSDTERMRIDSSGQLFLGKTSGVSGAFFQVAGDASNQSIRMENAYGTGIAQLINNTSGQTFNAILFENSGTSGSISVTTSSTAYNTSSDARLKNVLGEAKGLEIINKLNPINFEWKESKEIQDGLIAQEVMEIVPNAVTGSEEDMYQMDYSKLVTPLIKAIQELSAEVEELKTKLESK
tara:strand:- start:41 stop:1123 length:1083 start_codon:yes stop_codon:yes gene_type:complete